MITFRSGAVTVNATASASIVVTRPSGVIADDVMVAYVFVADDRTITPPAGWTHRLTVTTASTSARMAAYTRVAGGGEPASYTWTLGVGDRAWGYIAAYDGVDVSDPLLAVVGQEMDTGEFDYAFDAMLSSADHSCATHAVGADRAATGVATTWATFDATERDDFSSNNGAGVDISGAAWDHFPGMTPQPYVRLIHAEPSQAQAEAILIAVQLRPLFTAFDPQARILVMVEAAFGADPDGDADLWTWVDISDYIRESPGVTITKGRSDEAARVEPTRVALALDNDDGRFTPTLATSPHYPHVLRNTPIRVSVTGFGAGPPYERAVAFVDEWLPSWDLSANDAWVAVSASGRLRRLGQGARSSSPAYRAVASELPVAYWPCEDGSGATHAGSAVAGAIDALVVGGNPGAADGPAGSERLLVMPSGATLTATVPTYLDTGTAEWVVMLLLNIPAAPGVEAMFLEWHTGGTARRWTLNVTPAGAVRLIATNAVGTQILAATIGNLSPVNFGVWLGVSIRATQSGGNIAYDTDVQREGSNIFLGAASGAFTATMGKIERLSHVATADTNGTALGHLAVFGDAGPGVFAFTTIKRMLDASVGDDPQTRFTRLCDEDQVPADSPDPFPSIVSATLGSQPAGSLLDLLHDTADADGAFFHDGGTGGRLIQVLRLRRYNTAVSLALSASVGHLAPGFGPTYDDQRIRNDITVRRFGGSSARVTDPASITDEGRYAEELQLNVQTDAILRPRAEWEVHLGTLRDLRYPQVSIDLRAAPELAEQWLGCEIGSRCTVSDLPAQHPPDPVSLTIEGYTEHLSQVAWSVTANCSPERGWQVAVLEGDGSELAPPLRLDHAASTLAAGVNTVAATLSVASVGGLWSTTDEPYDIDIAGERVTVTAVTGASSPQSMTVVRSVNGVVKAHSTGAQVRLWRPPGLAF